MSVAFRRDMQKNSEWALIDTLETALFTREREGEIQRKARNRKKLQAALSVQMQVKYSIEFRTRRVVYCIERQNWFGRTNNAVQHVMRQSECAAAATAASPPNPAAH